MRGLLRAGRAREGSQQEMQCRVRRKVGEAVNFLSGERLDREARTAAGEGGRSRTFSYKLSNGER